MTSDESLKTAFTSALHLDPQTDCENLAYGQTTGWDSVAHMALIATIEGTFDIMLETDEVIDLSSFAKAKEIVGRHGVTF